MVVEADNLKDAEKKASWEIWRNVPQVDCTEIESGTFYQMTPYTEDDEKDYMDDALDGECAECDGSCEVCNGDFDDDGTDWYEGEY